MWVSGGGEPNWDDPVHSWIYGPDTPRYDEKFVHDGEYSFRLVNAKNPKKLPWAAFSIDLGPATDITVEPKKISSYDASKHAYFVFWIRGLRGGERFDVSFRDANLREVSLIPIPKEASQEWIQVKIPLSSISKEVDLTQLDVVSLHFGDSVGNQQGATLYLDDISFTGIPKSASAVKPLKKAESRGLWIADFEQELSLLNGEMVPYGSAKGNFNDRTTVHSALYNPELSDYSVNNVFRGKGSFRLINEMPVPKQEHWGSLAISLVPLEELRKGSKSTIGVDVSQYRYLLFWAKGHVGGERIKVLFRDGHVPGYLPQVMVDPYPMILTKEWQKIVVPLNQVSYKVDLTNIVQIGVEFGSWLGNLKGDMLYVDDFVFSNMLSEP